jgi:RimJ/RimL family protein N-acetyltransferase
MTHAFAMSVPILQTERLLLRAYRPEDFDAFAEHTADAESMVHLSVKDRQTAWRIFGSHAGLWLLHGAGWWAVELRETGQVVGTVGAFFREQSSDMEIGWNTYRAFWGKGIAGEAAAAMVDHAFTVRREPSVHALISEGNTSSIRVAERLGLAYKEETSLYGKVIGKYVRERS